MKTAHLSYLRNRFNAAAWRETQSGKTVLILREVEKGGLPGEPDKGKLVRLVLNGRRSILSETTVWQPLNDDQHLEDPRAIVLSDGSTLLGLTAVIKKDAQQYLPYPAITKLDEDGMISQVSVIEQFGQGKNVTPFDEKTWVFRREGDNHKLLVFEWDGKAARWVSEIDFSQHIPSWAKWRMGTTMSPIWITDTEALLLIHGIRFEGGIYHYSIGRAKLVKVDNAYAITAIDEKPLIEPSHFVKDGTAMYQELHAFRRVVYSCGGVIRTIGRNKVLTLYVNVGDRQTVEVRFSLNQLLKDFWV